MPKVTVQVQVESSADTLGKCVVDLVTAAKKALADGWQPLQDVPVLVLAATSDLMTAVGAISQVPADWAEDKGAFAKGLTLRVEEAVAALLP